tara:strand:+ start:24818 stop:25729 length:912 start_codon:yes stop_codon:yes gene_type:complete
MKVLSIDVGIKNLAYCIINYDDVIDIVEWDIIDICREKHWVCKNVKKDKTVCNKQASYHKNDIYYCKIHSKKQAYLVPDKDMLKLYKQIKKEKVSLKKLHTFIVTHSLLPELASKLAPELAPKLAPELAPKVDLRLKNVKKILKKYSKPELMLKVVTFIDENYLNCIEKMNTNTLNMIDCAKLLKKHLDNNFGDKDLDKIIIENQIGPLALRMKMVQGMITQHFIENGKTNIEYINASNKLKDFLNKKKTTYNERKKMGIEVTRGYINDHVNLHKWTEIFNKHSKKDDLADSFLQALWYVNHL